MAKSVKKFFVVQKARRYDDSVKWTPKCYKRFSTKEEAEACAEEMNKLNSKEKREAMYREWVSDPATEWATEEWYERFKQSEMFYLTYEAKETK